MVLKKPTGVSGIYDIQPKRFFFFFSKPFLTLFDIYFYQSYLIVLPCVADCHAVQGGSNVFKSLRMKSSSVTIEIKSF